MSVVDARNFSLPQQHQLSRKPLTQRPAGTQAAQASSQAPPFQPAPPSNPGASQREQSYHQPRNNPQYWSQQQQQQQPQLHQTPGVARPEERYGYSHSRTASSAGFPNLSTNPQPSAQQMSQNMYPSQYQQRASQQYQPRTSSRQSIPTFTTSATAPTSQYETSSNPNMPMRQNSAASSDLHRSTSSTSSNSSTSYVVLMRKQKATVWSDRTQHEDPRMVAQQRLAKQRAIREVSGQIPGSRVSTSGNSSITTGVRAKIRHHGVSKAQQYTPGFISASGVPVRLSQNEIDEDDSDDDGAAMHRPTDSGRSSMGSGGRVGSMQASQQSAGSGQYGLGMGPSAGQSNLSPDDHRSPVGSAEETPVPGRLHGRDYFSQTRVGESAALTRASSGGSGSTGRENSFGGVGKLPERKKEEGETLDAAELRRRGSVDERTMTMSGYGKLFVANPDADD